MKRSALILFALLSMLSTPSAIPDYGRGAARVPVGEQRVALVIGNKDYPDRVLKNPINDARDIKAALEKLGFSVVYRENADFNTMDGAMHEFTDRLGRNGIGLFYFAGHGMQADETNYLLPVGVPIATKAELKARGYDARIALDSMAEAGARVSVVILDACRNAPVRGSTGGLAEMGSGAGSIIAFAAGPKQTAEDGSGRNGTYTKHLLAHLAEPGITALQALEKTQNDVAEETRDTQQPWINHGPLHGQFCFAGCADAASVAAPEPSPAVKEQKFWDDIKNSQNPADFQAYLEQFPNGLHAGLARNNIKRLQALEMSKADNLDRPHPNPPPEGEGIIQNRPSVEILNPLATGDATQNPLTPGEGRVRVKPTAASSNSPPSNPFGIDMVSLPGGSFQMGCGPKDGECQDDEKPRHAVNVKPFAIGRTEITQGQWQAVMGSAPPDLYFKDCGEDCPVERVSWNDVQIFINTLNQKTRGHYSLPSEAEWEYACRAGQDTRYCGGNDLDAVAWYDGNSGGKTHPVGGKAANPFGLYDMSGNIREWVQDCYHDSYQGAPTDGGAWDGGANCANGRRVLRGGSFSFDQFSARCAARYGPDLYPWFIIPLPGFRIAVSPL